MTPYFATVLWACVVVPDGVHAQKTSPPDGKLRHSAGYLPLLQAIPELRPRP
jgi:hypothetical protein